MARFTRQLRLIRQQASKALPLEGSSNRSTRMTAHGRRRDCPAPLNRRRLQLRIACAPPYGPISYVLAQGKWSGNRGKLGPASRVAVKTMSRPQKGKIMEGAMPKRERGTVNCY